MQSQTLWKRESGKLVIAVTKFNNSKYRKNKCYADKLRQKRRELVEENRTNNDDKEHERCSTSIQKPNRKTKQKKTEIESETTVKIREVWSKAIQRYSKSFTKAEEI